MNKKGGWSDIFIADECEFRHCFGDCTPPVTIKFLLLDLFHGESVMQLQNFGYTSHYIPNFELLLRSENAIERLQPVFERRIPIELLNWVKSFYFLSATKFHLFFEFIYRSVGYCLLYAYIFATFSNIIFSACFCASLILEWFRQIRRTILFDQCTYSLGKKRVSFINTYSR